MAERSKASWKGIKDARQRRLAVNAEVNASVVPSVSPSHAHRYRIEEPNGPISSGVCQICSVQRDFRNGSDDPAFYADNFGTPGLGSNTKSLLIATGLSFKDLHKR